MLVLMLERSWKVELEGCGSEMWHVGWRRMGKVVPNSCLLSRVVFDDISSTLTFLDSPSHMLIVEPFQDELTSAQKTDDVLRLFSIQKIEFK